MTQDKLVIPSGFAEQLGTEFNEWVKTHPTPDAPVMRFVGENTDGQTGTFSMSPRQYANEITNQTPFGQKVVQDLLIISRNLGDPTGQKVINDLRQSRVSQIV